MAKQSTGAVMSGVFIVVACVTGLFFATVGAAEQGPARVYNTVKQKLMDGEKVVGGTVSTPDPDIYCAMANAGYDFLWIEMQHSPLSYQEVARMIWACRDGAGHTVHPRPGCIGRCHPEGSRHRRPGHHRSNGVRC